jgi:hypothetical protein
MQSRETKLQACTKDYFQSICLVHLSDFTNLLIRLRNRLDGDFDLALVPDVIGRSAIVGRLYLPNSAK